LTFEFSGDTIHSRDIALQDANYENAALSYIKGYDCKELYLMMYGDREFDFIAVHICTVFFFKSNLLVGYISEYTYKEVFL